MTVSTNYHTTAEYQAEIDLDPDLYDEMERDRIAALRSDFDVDYEEHLRLADVEEYEDEYEEDDEEAARLEALRSYIDVDYYEMEQSRIAALYSDVEEYEDDIVYVHDIEYVEYIAYDDIDDDVDDEPKDEPKVQRTEGESTGQCPPLQTRSKSHETLEPLGPQAETLIQSNGWEKVCPLSARYLVTECASEVDDVGYEDEVYDDVKVKGKVLSDEDCPIRIPIRDREMLTGLAAVAACKAAVAARKHDGDEYDQELATRLGRPVWRWIIHDVVRLSLKEKVSTALGSTTREGRLYAAPCWRFIVQIAVGSVYYYDHYGLPISAEADILQWGPPIAIPHDVRQKIVDKDKNKDKKKSNLKKSASSAPDLDRKRMVQLLVAAGLVKIDPFGPGHCTRYRLRWGLLKTLLHGCLDVLDRDPATVRWGNLVNGQILSPLTRHPLFEPENKGRTKAAIKKERQRKVVVDEKTSTPIKLAWREAVALTRSNLLRSTALQSPRLRARATRDLAVLHSIRTSPTFKFIDGHEIAQYVPEYEIRSAGRLYEQGYGIQTASRELKQALALGDPKTDNWNYDLKSCHAWAYDALCAGINSWLAYTDQDIFTIDRKPLLDLLTKESAWTHLAEKSGLPEDAIKAGLYSMLNGGVICTPSYPEKRTDRHTGKVTIVHKLTAAGEIARDHCPRMKPSKVARLLKEALAPVSVQVRELARALAYLIEQGNMQGTTKYLRKIVRIRVHNGELVVENAVKRRIKADEELSRIISHILTGCEQDAINLVVEAAAFDGVHRVAAEHDGAIFSGKLSSDAISFMEQFSAVGHATIKVNGKTVRQSRAILRVKNLCSGRTPYDVREDELRALYEGGSDKWNTWNGIAIA